MLGHGRFHFETPNVIDPGEDAISQPTRPAKDDDAVHTPPQRNSSHASASSHSSSGDYVYKPPLSRTIKLDYRLAHDDEPAGDDNHADDEEYGVPSPAKSNPGSPASTHSHEQARLFAATILSESERRSSKRNLFDGNQRVSPVRKIWNDAIRRSPGDDMAPLRKAVGMENDGLMREQETQKSRPLKCFLIVMAVVSLFLLFVMMAARAMKGRHADPNMSERMQSVVDALVDGNVSRRKQLTRTGSAHYQAAMWIADMDAEQVDIPKNSLESSRFLQRYVLALLYYSWGGSNWVNGLHFTSDMHECSWFDNEADENGERFAVGVACDDNLSVRGLLLPSNNLKGTIPAEIKHLDGLDFLSLKHNEMSGPIPQSLTKLNMLAYLDLKFNQFTGTIPEFLGDIQCLEVLGLGKNSLEGTLPSTLGDLRLKTLSVDDNMLTGDLTVVGSITTLEYLYAGDNDFSGQLGDIIVAGMDSLEEAVLSGNRVEAPSVHHHIFSLPKLRVLDLSDNSITGAIPEELPSNTALEYLDLRLNAVSSSIPDSIANLSGLMHLDLEANAVTGIIPDKIADLEKLTYLFLGKNPMRGGDIPEVFQSLTSLRELALDDIQLEGSIPAWLDQLTDLKLLDLRHNGLTGSIEDLDFSKLGGISYLLLSDNKLTGLIPDSLNALDQLAVIALHHNGFVGQASDICTRGSSLQLITTDCGAVECDCCGDCCDSDNCFEGSVWDALENSQGDWEQRFRRSDYGFNPHILVPHGGCEM